MDKSIDKIKFKRSNESEWEEAFTQEHLTLKLKNQTPIAVIHPTPQEILEAKAKRQPCSFIKELFCSISSLFAIRGILPKQAA